MLITYGFNEYGPMVGEYNNKMYRLFHWEAGGLMVSALDSGSSDSGSSPCWGTVLCSWARHFTLIVALFTQVYKWVLANLMLGVTL